MSLSYSAAQAGRDAQGGHLGRGHVPPDPGARQVGVRDDGHHDHDRAGVAAGSGQRVPQLGRGGGAAGPGAEPGRDLHQVEAEVVTLQPRRL